ncbi:MAG: SurA N-terminal domain-containing protein [Patescibacteria group bacterium]
MKKTIKKNSPKTLTAKTIVPSVLEDSINTDASPKQGRFKSKRWMVLIAILVIAGIFLFTRGRKLLLAGTVNGQPILKMTLSQRLTDRFGKQMLEALIAENLILEEAGKKKVTADAQEVKAKIASIEAELKGSMTLDDSLALQGVTRPEFENQIRLQLLIDKMLSSEATISTEEVTVFVQQNSKTMTATTDAGRTQEAEETLKNNKMTKIFSEWFAKIKEQAKIERYL